MTINEVLKTIRKEMNISQEALARDLNVSYTTINRWENGRSLPSRLARMRLIEYCLTRDISQGNMDLLKRNETYQLKEEVDIGWAPIFHSR